MKRCCKPLVCYNARFMVAEVQSKLPAIIAACESAGIQRLYVFGSAAGASNHPFDDSSDVDFVVEIDRDQFPLRGLADPFWTLWIRLEDLFAPRQIQLIEPRHTRNPGLLAAISRTRELIYDRSREKAAG